MSHICDGNHPEGLTYLTHLILTKIPGTTILLWSHFRDKEAEYRNVDKQAQGHTAYKWKGQHSNVAVWLSSHSYQRISRVKGKVRHTPLGQEVRLGIRAGNLS